MSQSDEIPSMDWIGLNHLMIIICFAIRPDCSTVGQFVAISHDLP